MWPLAEAFEGPKEQLRDNITQGPLVKTFRGPLKTLVCWSHCVAPVWTLLGAPKDPRAALSLLRGLRIGNREGAPGNAIREGGPQEVKTLVWAPRSLRCGAGPLLMGCDLYKGAPRTLLVSGGPFGSMRLPSTR